jgi:hypothetical protein
MTPSADLGTLPLTRLTVASLQDQGFQVNFETANSFSLPSPQELAIMGAGAGENVRRRCSCGDQSLDPIVLPKRALLD